MKCKVCGSKDIVLVSKHDNTKNEYVCLGCQRTIITEPENKNKDIRV